jgi:hypothetical protein
VPAHGNFIHAIAVTPAQIDGADPVAARILGSKSITVPNAGRRRVCGLAVASRTRGS